VPIRVRLRDGAGERLEERRFRAGWGVDASPQTVMCTRGWHSFVFHLLDQLDLYAERRV